MMTNNKTKKKPLALYVHIPFCVQKCLYCDFLSAPMDGNIRHQYVSVLQEELVYWQKRLEGRYEIQTVFIGGGTPTVLEPDLIHTIGDTMQAFSLSPGMEYTMEANPGTVTAEHGEVMKQIGVNRVSLGVQSAQEKELQALGRIHTYEEFVESYRLLRQQGFDNINVDLMTDIPGQTLASYTDTLDQILALQPEHISSYSLMIEEGTPFYEMYQAGRLQIPSEETDRLLYEWTRERLAMEGYARYEISNYAREGFACKHNLTYWQMGEYLGVGLGAASYVAGERFSNERNLNRYLSQPADHHIVERHLLSKREEMEEFVFLGLRTMQGISCSDYEQRFHADFHEIYRDVLPPLIKGGLLAESENHDKIYLTNRGIDVSNTVLAEFLLEEE